MTKIMAGYYHFTFLFTSVVLRRHFELALVAQSDAYPTCDQEVRFPLGRQHSFVKIDHEIFSTVILSLRLIQEGQLSQSQSTLLIMCIHSP